MRPVAMILVLVCQGVALSSARAGELRSGEYFVTQSWSQEQQFPRPYDVVVPNRTTDAPLPVFIFLHGNGGDGRGAMRSFLRRHRTLARQYVMVFPTGYLKSWNIVSERSKADDLAFVEAIVTTLAEFRNVDGDDITIMGSSNGAALVNQLAIESRLPNIRNCITVVSPLNVFQHDGQKFRSRGKDNSYKSVVTPLTGRRLLNVAGTLDHLVPYRGGPSRGIPAKGKKLAFVAAEQSTYLWARHMGYHGQKLKTPTRREGPVEVFSYLDGNVVHCKVSGEGHGAGRAISEKFLLDFLAE